MDQTHGKSYGRKSELYAIPPWFSLREQQLSGFSVTFSDIGVAWISLRRSARVRSGFVCSFGYTLPDSAPAATVNDVSGPIHTIRPAEKNAGLNKTATRTPVLTCAPSQYFV
ncbi:hypothetical protein [Paraburkholderia saeva]|uniref:hypothetical protein n=1 Tax=Paraburkholderia saeva TaxID=2777537 RepID=UPI001E6569B2|nr:hypothetical protein [Paraburkholderia saeva]